MGPQAFWNGADLGSLPEIGKLTGFAIEIVSEKPVEKFWVLSPTFKGGLLTGHGDLGFHLGIFREDELSGGTTFYPQPGISYSFIVNFGVSVHTPAPAPSAATDQLVKELEAAVRDASAAYFAYRKAVAAGDFEEIRRLSGPDRADFTGDRKKVLRQLKADEPADIQIQGGVGDNEQVVLRVTGRDGSHTWRGMVFMRYHGVWQVNREGWDSIN